MCDGAAILPKQLPGFLENLSGLVIHLHGTHKLLANVLAWVRLMWDTTNFVDAKSSDIA